jgi:hypothetical protein
MILAVEAYDASEVEERPRSAYLSRKDVRVILVLVAFFVLLMVPIYMVFKQGRDRHLCKQYIGQIFKAVQIYSIEWDNRFPPVYAEGPGGEPALLEPGNVPYTWMSLIQGGMSARSSFLCPAAGEEETVRNMHPEPEKEPFRSSFGMYRPWSAYNVSMVSDPDNSVLVAETSNNGARDTYDPVPFSHGVDGIVIGWNNDNFRPNSESEYVTRLAFPETKGGRFRKDGPGRHGDGIHVLYISGQYAFVKPNSAMVHFLTAGKIKTEMVGMWADR